MTTGAVSTVVGPASSGSGAYADSANPADVSFETPSSLTSDGRYLYFVDAGNIRRTDPTTGATTTAFGAGYINGCGVANAVSEGADGNLYVTTASNSWWYGWTNISCVLQLDPATGGEAQEYQTWGYGMGSFGQITSNATGVYFRTGNAIDEFAYSSSPTVSNLVTSTNLSDASDGFTAAGSYLYAVSDSGTTIRRIDATTGAMTLVAGSPGGSGYANGSYYFAWFNSAQALASDGQGTLYVADANNNRVRTVTEASPSRTRTQGRLPGSPRPSPSVRARSPPSPDPARLPIPTGPAPRPPSTRPGARRSSATPCTSLTPTPSGQ